jgi:tetratricopeptide (TPR) repeat protein
MEEELKKLNELSAFFKRMNTKVILLRLIECAKAEYDKYNFDEAKKNLEEGFKLDNKNSTVLRGLGCIEQFKGNYELAIDYFKKALEKSKAKEVEYTLIGMAYYLQDKLDEAVEYFNLAIDSNDDYPNAYDGRNQAMLENHLKILDLQEALKKYF